MTENLSFVTKPPSGDLEVERKQKLRKLFLKSFSILRYQANKTSRKLSQNAAYLQNLVAKNA